MSDAPQQYPAEFMPEGKENLKSSRPVGVRGTTFLVCCQLRNEGSGCDARISE